VIGVPKASTKLWVGTGELRLKALYSLKGIRLVSRKVFAK
jgi:hypothetical protein